MKKCNCITILLLFTVLRMNAQQYTQPIYSVRKDSAVVFGDETPLNYCGNPFILKMNIYKPVGDGNTQRPVVICVHGGAFTSGVDFNEGSMNIMANEFARRGYVAVSINYREGHHLFPYGTGNPQFKDAGAMFGFNIINGGTNWTTQARLYVTDSAEVIRSIYRAQQDVKAAIRKMKQRRLTDSTSSCRVFLAGHSAGGISVLAAAMTDRSTEKPVLANAIAAAPNPQWTNRCEWEVFGNCVTWQVEGPAGRDDQAYSTHNPAPFNYNAASCYLRPDLGDVDGDVNLSSAANTKIMGVASFCGAVVDTLLFDGNTYPPIFMYHQPADRVVDYNTNRPFSFLNDFFTPGPNNNWPLFYGSNWIKNKLNRMNYPAANVLWTYDNSQNDPLGTTTHDLIPSIAFVTDSVAKFFSRIMDTAVCTTAILALPISFTAEKMNGNALLRWTMNTNAAATEGFIIQHSVDGRNFSEIATIAYQQNLANYSFEHRNAIKGMNYYRLKIINRNGSIEYTEIRSLNFGAGNKKIRLFPNPVANQLTVILPEELVREHVQVIITNASGKVIMKTTSRNNTEIQLNCTGLLPGIYFVTFSGESVTVTEKITKAE